MNDLLHRIHSFRLSFCLVLAGLTATICFARALAAEPPQAQDPTRPFETIWPPKGQPVKLPVNKDTWVSSIGSERIGNNGGASQLKLKGEQELSIIDVDPAPLKGKIITGALLHVKCSSPKEPLRRVTVSTIAAPWVEGKSSGYVAEEGASCWSFAQYSATDKKAVSWTFPGSHVLDAGFGLGNTIWKFADATSPDKQGWQTIAVDSDVVAARVAGLSYGFGLWDDVGNEWSYKDNKFTFIQHLNRFIFSKDQNASSAPWLQVWTEGTDTVAPDSIDEKGLAVDVEDYPPGQAMVTWITPADKGGTKALGFDVTYKAGQGPAKPMPRYLVPMAAAAGQPVKMHIQDLPFKAGEPIELSIAPVDAAGNKGKVLVKKIEVSANPAALAIEPADIKPFEPSTNLPEVGGLKVAVLDLIDKVEARTGKMVPEHEDGYKGGNHLWSSEKRIIRLQAARNEAIGFVVNLEGKTPAAGLKLAFPEDSGLRDKVYRLDYVKTGAGAMPDAAVPLTGTLPIPSNIDPEAADQTNACLLAEIYVPHAAKAGQVKGTLTVTSSQNLQIPIDLTIWDFTLPNKLSFLPEMNAYGTVGPNAEGLAYYRLAHEHRTCINKLPYGWNGSASIAPKWDGKALDFTEWDKQYAPILSGAAFANLPRKGEPVDVFYLPFNESWPMSIWDSFHNSYWPEDAFTPQYREGVQKAYAQFAKHLDQMKWHDTEFQFFLNNKVYYKEQGSGWKNSAAPWIFDEPVNTQDFWALRWYGLLWHQAVDSVKGQVKAWYRCDISRSDFGRNVLWDVMDVDYFGGSSEQKARQKHDEQNLSVPTYFCEYGGANDPGTSNIAPVTWCILAWSRGAIGVLPWDTMGKQDSWSRGEPTCLFYPAQGGPVASIRLKAFCRGQEDVEYLTLLGSVYNAPPYAVAAGLEQTIGLSGRVIKRSEEDAGIIRFDKVNPTSLWQMRYRVGKMVSAKKPEYKRALVNHASPAIDLSKLPDIGHVKVAPKVEPARPE
ncbi:MAG TPA: DUF4091 domain-containing protein [Phycisphaerae bacterium]|nr:DUF4091 domain-containing protein [Phycisphaerae bacterium]HRY70088.1 DUF4091 domain-containing protein [Phycisphaerae bacterium]HSA27364.1 DUF4091 domain-containing protein [Phycisphaerae bacterium]